MGADTTETADEAARPFPMPGRYDAVVRLRAEWPLRHQRPGCIHVDLARVASLDAAGIRAMLTCQADARQIDCVLKLVKPQPPVYRVLPITGPLQHFGLDKPRTTLSPPWIASAASIGLLN